MGKSTPNPPAAPYFQPVDIASAAQNAFNYDVQSYDWKNQDFINRFPGLVATRTQQLDDAYNQLTGPTDPTVLADFTNTGLGQGLNSVGGGDSLSGLGMTQGSFGQNVASASVANQLLNKQDADRQNFNTLLGNNPQTPFGPGGADIASLMALNTGTLNSTNQQAYSSQLAGIYGQGQIGVAQGQQISAIGALLARLGQNNYGYGSTDPSLGAGGR
jgi:hypothetical protein